MKRSARQASREPDHKHPAWETNEMGDKWETNEKETNERSGRQMKAQASRKPDHKTQPDK